MKQACQLKENTFHSFSFTETTQTLLAARLALPFCQFAVWSVGAEHNCGEIPRFNQSSPYEEVNETQGKQKNTFLDLSGLCSVL